MQTVSLHTLHIGPVEDGAAEVGRVDTGVFVSIPAFAVGLIRDLSNGYPLHEVSERFTKEHGQAPDLDDFLAVLAECGFIREESAEEPERLRGWHLFATLPTARVAWLLSRPAALVWTVIWAAVPVILILRPDLIPVGTDGRLGLGVALDAVLLTVLAWGLVFVHEVAHLVAVRARGCAGALRLSNRLYFLVAETDMSGIRSLTRRERYAPYLAGMTLNMALLAGVTVLRMSGVDGQMVRAVGYTTAAMVLFEFALFMRTDVYYVVANALRLGNLMTDTWHWVGNRIAALVGRPQPFSLAGLPARELRIVRWYSVVLVAGVGVAIGQFVIFGLPLMLSFGRDSLSQLGLGPAVAGFWDATILLLLFITHFSVLAVVSVRRRLRQRRGDGPRIANA